MLVNGVELNVRERGEGNPFIWAHGLTSSIRTEEAIGMYHWDDFGDDHRLIRFDARGHGRSRATTDPGDYHWRNLATDMLGIADLLELDRFIAGGQSMGAATTIYAALHHPDRVSALVLMNPPTAWETRSAQASTYRRLAMVGGMVGGARLAGLMEKIPARLLPDENLPDDADPRGTLEGLRPMTRTTLETLFTGAALTDLPPRDEIAAISAPTLILAWPDDPTHPVETATELARLLAASDLHVATGPSDVGRWPALIRDFVQGVT